MHDVANVIGMAHRTSRRAPEPVSEEDARFLATYDVTRFERPSVAVDVALITADDDALHTLLVRRAEPPQRGRWALPGTFVRMSEPLDDAAARALAEKAASRGVFLEQLYTFGAPDRDPRTRVITVAYFALLDRRRLPAPGEDAVLARLEVPWEGEDGGPVTALGDEGEPLALAFDHAEILGAAVKRLRGKLDYTPIGFELLGDRFTLAELQRVHETILGRAVNKDSFRRKMVASGMIEGTGELREGGQHRPAELFRFRREG
jgi:8-oxo-dGTP diphosphatase